ncbi:MAG: hypothetical protein U0736_14990 [Gemmataceae bacterium]
MPPIRRAIRHRETLGPVDTYGRNIARSMYLMATSTPQSRNTVRVLFYGQSITEQDWTRRVAADLRRRFPHAHLVIENRAIGGFAARCWSRPPRPICIRFIRICSSSTSHGPAHRV